MKQIALFALLLFAASAFAAGREIAPRAFGPTPYRTQNAQTAFAGNRFLTVWTEFRGGIGSSTRGVLHDASGRRVSHAFPILPSAPFVHLTGAGNSFALFWNDGTRTFLTDIDLEGRVTRTTPLALPDADFPPGATWNGTRFLLARESYEGRWETRISLVKRSGAMVHANMLLPDSIRAFHSTPVRGGFAVVTGGEKGVCARRITNGGIVNWIGCVPMERPPTEASPVGAPTADGGVLMVWTGSAGELRSAVVHTGGTVGPVNILAFDGAYPLRTRHLSHTGDGYVLLFTREQSKQFVKTMILDADGAAQGPALEIAPNRSSELMAASSGETTLAVFEEARFPSNLQRVVIASDGTLLGPPEPITIDRAQQTQPALANMGSRMLAAWTDAFAANAFVVTASLAPDGAPLFFGTVTQGHLVSRDLPSNGSEVLVVSKRDVANGETKVQASFVSRDGAPLAAGMILLGDTSTDYPTTATAAWVEDHWLVAWTSPDVPGVSFSIIRNHELSSTRTISVSTPTPEDRHRLIAHVALARTATTTLLVWTEELPLNCNTCRNTLYRTYATRIPRDGDLMNATPIEIPSGRHSLSVATSGDELMILAGGTATVIDAAASRILRSSTIFGWDAAGDVHWDGSAYTVALRYKLARWYLSVTHLDRRGIVIGAQHGIETLAAEALAPPSIAGSVIALQEGDFVNGARAVVRHESDLPALPPPPAMPIVRLSDAEFEHFVFTWDPVPGAELYVVEEETFGWYQGGVQIVRADQPLRAGTRARSVRVIAVGAGGTSSPLRQRSARP